MSSVHSDAQGARVAVCVLDPDTLTVRWCNDFATQLLPEPHREHEVIGKSLHDLLPMSSVLGVVAALRELVATGEPFHLTTHVVGSKPRGRTVRASAYLMPSREILLVTEHP